MRRSDRRWDNPDPRALALAILVLLMVVGAAAVVPVWHAYAAVPDAALTDDRMRVLKPLAGRFRAAPPDLLLLGGSQVRELFPESAFMARELARDCGVAPTIINGATSGQLPSVQIAVLSRWGVSPKVTIVGFSPWRFFRPRPARAAHIRGELPLEMSPDFTGDAPGSPRRLLARALTVPIIASHLLETIVTYQPPPAPGNPFQAAQHRYTGVPWDRSRRIADALWEVRLASRTSDADIETNVRELETLAGVISSRGGAVVFLMVPSSPDTAVAYEPLAARVKSLTGRLSRSAPVFSAQSVLAPEAADFHDAVHLQEGGRKRLWPALRASLVADARVCGPTQ